MVQKTGKAKFWPWLFRRQSLNPLKLTPLRSEAQKCSNRRDHDFPGSDADSPKDSLEDIAQVARGHIRPLGPLGFNRRTPKTVEQMSRGGPVQELWANSAEPLFQFIGRLDRAMQGPCKAPIVTTFVESIVGLTFILFTISFRSKSKRSFGSHYHALFVFLPLLGRGGRGRAPAWTCH